MSIFKKCNYCQEEWISRDDFLADAEIKAVGYQVNFEHLEAGFFLFSHRCRTTLTIRAEFFTDLYNGEMFEDRIVGSENCLGYCKDRENLGVCPNKCECAYIRAVLDAVNKWEKKEP